MQNNINLIPVLITFTASAGALFLAGYFTLRHRVGLALVCMVCFLALLRPSVAMSAEVCQPVHFADGDTFTYLSQGQRVRVRVAGFDAPERGQPFSRVATQRMRELTEGGAQCDCYKNDKYGRSVCTVRTHDGTNVVVRMLSEGLGCIDPRFENEADPMDRKLARDALEIAQADRRGMWSQAKPVCGFDYRKVKRNAQR